MVSDEHQDFLDRLDVLDTKTGMTYCAGSEDIYKDVLSSYVEEEFDKKMQKALMEENWKDYKVYAHGMKSTSNTIGALGLSEAAKKLEMAAKDEKTIYIFRHHQEVIKEYQKIVQKIKDVIE